MQVFVSSLKEPIVIPISKKEYLGLTKGQQLTKSKLEQIQEESDVYQCDVKAAGLLANRDYSIGDFRRKLKLKNFGEQAIKEAVHKYKIKGILDDKKYAAKLITRLIKDKPAGKPFLIATLRQKLIPREMAEEVVDEIYQNENAVSLAVDALSRRWRQFRQFEVEAARTKSYNYLSRRGFSYSAAKEAFTILWEKEFGGGENEVKIY